MTTISAILLVLAVLVLPITYMVATWVVDSATLRIFKNFKSFLGVRRIGPHDRLLITGSAAGSPNQWSHPLEVLTLVAGGTLPYDCDAIIKELGLDQEAQNAIWMATYYHYDESPYRAFLNNPWTRVRSRRYHRKFREWHADNLGYEFLCGSGKQA